jgi:hypothetical protein
MRKTVVLCLFLLCAVWAFAQTSPTQPSSPSQSSSPSSSQVPDQNASPTSGQNSQMGSSQSSSGNETKVTGCLNGSSGNYTLTDSSGKTWQLSGDTSKLSEHVGHQVEITGTPASASSSTGNPGGASAGSSGSSEQSTLNVTSMKHIATTCTPPSH